MGGLIGHNIASFTIAAGLLHAPVDVDLHRASAVIDPGIATSLVTPDFAARLALKPSGRQMVDAYRLSAPLATIGPVAIGLHAAHFDLRALAIETPEIQARAPDADIVLGRDMLTHATLALDLAHDTIGAVADSDLRSVTRSLQKIPAGLDPEGRIHVAMTIRGIVYPAILDLAAAGAVTAGPGVLRQLAAHEADTSPDRPIPIEDARIGDVVLPGLRVDPDRGQAFSAGIVLGLPAFKGHRMVLDLAHDAIWLK